MGGRWGISAASAPGAGAFSVSLDRGATLKYALRARFEGGAACGTKWNVRRHSQVAKATVCKTVNPGSNPGAASSYKARQNQQF